jgi:hypothetical protein
MAISTAAASQQVPTTEYARLEERIIERDQVGASQVLYGLFKQGRPVTEILRETIRIHAPYTHVPYHQRLDDGMVKFVNNDHCLLGERVSLPLRSMIAPELGYLPLAQVVWYMPTGLDPWNQLLGRAPGHYTRLYEIKVEREAAEARAALAGPGAPAPRRPHRGAPQPLAHAGAARRRARLLSACSWASWRTRRIGARCSRTSPSPGLIDVQDRMFHNRSYTTGHKSFRARATIELGEAIGWDRAHDVLYAGVPDMAVGPRWHSTYEMGCNVVQNLLEGRDRELLAQDGPLTAAEEAMLVDVILRQEEPSVIEALVALLRAGRAPRRILDAIQVAAAQVILDTGNPNNFSMAQHGYEYCNTVGWFYDTFDHPHRLKLLFVAASFINHGSHHQADTPDNGRRAIVPPPGAASLSSRQLLEQLDQMLLALRADEAVGLTAAYLTSGFERAPLVQTLATAACKIGNDPHNQELGLCLLEDYLHTQAAGRDRLLLASAKHTAGHKKYGDPLESYRRFAEALDLAGC